MLRCAGILLALLLSSCALPDHGGGRIFSDLSKAGLTEGVVTLPSGNVTVDWRGREEIKLQDFDRIVPAAALREKDFASWVTSPGLGEAAVLYRKKRRDDDRVSDLGTALPVTMVTENGVLTICDVLEDDHYAGRQLSTNFTAPLAYMRKQGDLHLPVVKAMLRSGDYLKKAGLYRFEPVDTGRIPVIFVHGLKSSPSIWKMMVNELRRDKNVRENYQFWSFSYPTGIPVVYAAKLLRDELKGIEAMYNPDGTNPNWNHMIVAGHSMGGLVTRLQVTDSGSAFWDTVENLKLPEDAELILKDNLIFKPQPYIDRVVFMATPHGGSEIATSRIGAMISRLIRLPTEIVNVALETLDMNPQIGKDRINIPTSIDDLAPGSDFIKTLASLPVSPGVTYHSIIASGGEKNITQESMNDGLVTYKSASLAGAASEVIVPSGHRAPNHPAAVAEMLRILKVNLKQKGKR